MFRALSGRRLGDQAGVSSMLAIPSQISSIAGSRLAVAKAAFTTRRVNLADATQIVRDRKPKAGDLTLARIETVGHHTRIEAPNGRRRRLYPGDEIIVAYGDRYAPDQFEAVIPADLGRCDLVAGGGLAGRVVHRHASVGKPTRILPIGLLADQFGQVLNLSRYALSKAPPTLHRPTAIIVVGTSMNAGKTTTAASLIRGLSAGGLTVGAAKLTGTGSGNDIWSMIDAGARTALDFTDMGHASTQGLDLDEVERTALGLIDHLCASSADILVLEIADGLYQRETAHLLGSAALAARIGGILFAAADAMGAVAGVSWLQHRSLPVLAVSGLVSASPLGTREVEEACGVPVFGIQKLADGEFAPRLCFSVDPETRLKLRLCG